MTCDNCGDTVDLKHLVDDPIGEYDMVCQRCADGRRRDAEEMQAYDYEYRMPEYQKHIR